MPEPGGHFTPAVVHKTIANCRPTISTHTYFHRTARQVPPHNRLQITLEPGHSSSRAMDESPPEKLEDAAREDVARGRGAQGTVNGKAQPCRVIIRTRVTNISGPPEDRARNLGQIFCSHVLKRQLRTRPDDDDGGGDGQPFDAVHLLPLCDSPHPVHAWFMYDLNFDSRAAPQDLAQIPHEVYLCSLIDGRWYVFLLSPSYPIGETAACSTSAHMISNSRQDIHSARHLV